MGDPTPLQTRCGGLLGRGLYGEDLLWCASGRTDSEGSPPGPVGWREAALRTVIESPVEERLLGRALGQNLRVFVWREVLGGGP